MVPHQVVKKLFILQKRAVRIILNAGYRDHTAPLFANLKILQLNDLYYFNLGKFMYKYMNNALPPCFNTCFFLTSDVHSYNTRSTSRKNLFVRYNRTSLYRNSLVQRGITYWNNLNDPLKASLTLLNFAKKRKTQLLSAYT